ncbi:biopolymer transporter ExbD [Chelativorans sp. ZYF759]|uniref:ExbD/TolR family protein n=1 Tax=Chelativorans sp. ZYF759 TaxID=2692213 RepID=UPI00145D70DD|nr:biopolymer transporter ExbD [Chelativorans sp. ZYF759]NMG41787.1 biopolymer transporter ExbD [Chelativorans sp. ZYF759]
MRIARPPERRKSEGTIALINVVFLMLIFFLIAGTLTPPLDPDVALAEAQLAEGSEPPDALFATAGGQLRLRGRAVSVEEFMATLDQAGAGASVKLAADRNLPAVYLIDIVAALKLAGAERVHIVTELARQ